MIRNIRYITPLSIQQDPLSFVDAQKLFSCEASSLVDHAELEDYLLRGGTLDQLLQQWLSPAMPCNVGYYSATQSDEKRGEFNDFFREISKQFSADGPTQEGYSQLLVALDNFIADPALVLAEMEMFEVYLQRHLPADIAASPRVTPTYLLAGAGYFVPGPPEKDYRPLRKNKIIEAMLTHFELYYGLNHYSEENYTNQHEKGPVLFKGFVDKFPKGFMKEKKMFKEDTQFGRMILHGKNAHRFLFILLCSYIERTCLKNSFIKRVFVQATIFGSQSVTADDVTLLSSEIGKKLYSLLMKKLVIPKTFSRLGVQETHLWNFLIDNVQQMKNEKLSRNRAKQSCSSLPVKKEYQFWLQNYCTPFYWEKYSFSSKSPFVFTSLMLCFTHERFPLFNRIMLDSFWKSLYQISYRFAKSLDSKFTDYQLGIMNEIDVLYQHSAIALALGNHDPGDVDSNFLGVLDQDAIHDNFSQKPYVEPHAYKGLGEAYGGWADYLLKKEQKLSH